MPTEFCPECELPIHIGAHPQIGQRLPCPHCGTNLQVTDVSPLEFYWADDMRPVVSISAGSSLVTRPSRRQH
jgi:hypothetical protein